MGTLHSVRAAKSVESSDVLIDSIYKIWTQPASHTKNISPQEQTLSLLGREDLRYDWWNFIRLFEGESREEEKKEIIRQFFQLNVNTSRFSIN